MRLSHQATMFAYVNDRIGTVSSFISKAKVSVISVLLKIIVVSLAIGILEHIHILGQYLSKYKSCLLLRVPHHFCLVNCAAFPCFYL